jgi:hypothetical protein
MKNHHFKSILLCGLVLISNLYSQTTTFRLEWNPVLLDTLGNEEALPVTYWIYGDSLCSSQLDEENFLTATKDTVFEHQVEQGRNYFYRILAVDEWGNRSVITKKTGNTPYVLSQIKIFLEGAFRENGDSMYISPDMFNLMPLQSPYSESNRMVPAHSNNTIDWILVSIYENPQDPSVYDRAFLLQTDGWLADIGNENTVLGFAGVDSGSYYVQVRHRNHAFILSNQTDLTKTPGAINFAGDQSTHHASSTAKQLKTNIWGIISGDLDQDGAVNNADYALWLDQARHSTTGYSGADLNFDGFVTTSDYTLWWRNSQ